MSWIFFWMVIQSFSWAAPARPLILSVGEKTKIPVRGDLVLGADKIVKARDLGGSFEIEAMKAGFTEFRSGSEAYEVSVLKQRQKQTLALLQNAVGRTLGLRAQVDRGDVVLTGKITGLPDWKKIAAACAPESCQYKSRFDTDERLRKQIQNHFSSLLQSFGYGVFRLRWEPEIQLLLPASLKANGEIEKIAAAYGLSVIQDAQALELAPSIRVQIMILEMKKSEQQKYGLSWPANYSAQLLPRAQGLDALLVSAEFLETRGLAKVLASPSLLCRSGKESEFLAGGEIPIKLMNFKMQDVVWKKYGILLRLKPQADFSGRMSLGIETEISSIDSSHTVDGIPGFYTNRVQSHFDLSEPRTIVLSGLLKDQVGDATQGVIGLSRIPVLGALFSSRDYLTEKTELVILVRPEIVPAHTEER